MKGICKQCYNYAEGRLDNDDKFYCYSCRPGFGGGGLMDFFGGVFGVTK